MNYQSKKMFLFIACVVIFILITSNSATACKDIIATGESTEGDYNLLLKVRDPSRAGLQVLTLVPKDYTYNYHHPWSGKPMEFTVNHSYIGVASQQDIYPNITKSGMVLTESGLAYGDADSQSRWINPTRYAWDDFDWIRYSCEQADSEVEAIHYLTTKAVDQLHATGVSENLCLVGPEKGYLIEADAYRYTTKEINDDIDVISNYARDLWNAQILRSRFIAESYNTTRITTVSKGDAVHLNGIARIRILQINSSFIKVRQIPFFTNIAYHDGKPSLFMPPKIIGQDESKTVGDFYITVNSINQNSATLTLTTTVNAWEQSLLNTIKPKKGNIRVNDMINWSRIQADDVNDIRPMCEAAYPYEGVAIFKIPQSKYSYLSKGWFSANHACSSIYVPFHNSNIDIYDKYETGVVATVCLSLYQNHSDSLLPIIKPIEEVFLRENDFFDHWAQNSTESKQTKIDLLTNIDIMMQEQAWMMQHLMYNITLLPENQQAILFNYSQKLWSHNYSNTMYTMAQVLTNISLIQNTSFYKETIMNLMKITPRTYIDVTRPIYKNVGMLDSIYNISCVYLTQEDYISASSGFQLIIDYCKEQYR